MRATKLYTTEAAARRAGVSGQTLVNLEMRKVIRPQRVEAPGREIRVFTDRDIERVIQHYARRRAAKK